MTTHPSSAQGVAQAQHQPSTPPDALTWLYVPGTRPDWFEKAMSCGPDVVILDLEDAVVPARKNEARSLVRDFVTGLGDRAAQIEVRVNAVGSDFGVADLQAFTSVRRLRAIRLPSVDHPDEVVAADRVLGGAHRLHCLLESARGVESAFAIARSCPSVCGIGLGETDLAADLGVADTAGLTWSRSRIVVAARAAGLPPPAMSVYPLLDDPAGLAAHCQLGRRLGFVGCSAVHPRQLGVIEAAFRPTDEDITWAETVLAALASGVRDGQAAVRTDDGRMVDTAMRRRAEQLLLLARRTRHR